MTSATSSILSKPGLSAPSRLLLVALALTVALIWTECVRAGIGRDDATGSVALLSADTELLAAELDPVFTQKLADRWSAPFMRARAAASQQDD
jgi:hypothetical protein